MKHKQIKLKGPSKTLAQLLLKNKQLQMSTNPLHTTLNNLQTQQKK